MEEKHYIEWIKVIIDGEVYRRPLKPGGKPEVKFKVLEEYRLRVRVKEIEKLGDGAVVKFTRVLT